MGGARRFGGFAVAAIAIASAIAVPGTTSGAVGDYVALSSSSRLVDTRPGATTVDGLQAGIGLRPAGSTLEVSVAGRAGVPLDADTAVLTVTAVDPFDVGFLTVHPTGSARPNASNVNYFAAHNTANTAVAKIGADGKVSIYTFAATHLIVDVSGYFPSGTDAEIGSPSRLVDTRPGATTVDGLQAGIGLRPAGSTLEVSVAGRAGVPLDADTAVLTVTAVDPLDVGFLTVHPTGTARPNASNVNYYAAHNTANTAVAKIGADGKVSIYTFAATHLIVDVSGHLPASSYTPLPQPRRLTDGRPGATTFDELQAGTGAVPGGNTLQVAVAGRAGVPTDASTAVLNVIAVDPVDVGFTTVHPTGTARPNASNVSYYRSHNMANTVFARIGAGGDVCVHTFATSYYIVDVAGYLTGPPPPGAGPTCPSGPLPTWGPSSERTGDSITFARSFAASGLGVVAATPSTTDGPPAATTVAFSADGGHWDDVAEIDGVRFWDVVDGGPGFVAVGHEDTDDIGYSNSAGEFPLPTPAAWTSTDGSTWTPATISPAPFEYGKVDSIASTPAGGFVAGGTVWNGDGPSDQTLPTVWTSPDGLIWTIRDDPFVTSEGPIRTWVAAGAGGTVFIANPFKFEAPDGPISAWWSADGVSWTAAPSIESFGIGQGRPSRVEALGSGFVMVGQDQSDHAIPRVWTSPDGRTWNDPVLLPVRPQSIQVIVGQMHGNGSALVLVGFDFDHSPDADPAATTEMWMTSDGSSWVRVPATALGVPGSFDSVGVKVALPFDGSWIALGSGSNGGADTDLIWRSV